MTRGWLWLKSNYKTILAVIGGILSLGLLYRLLAPGTSKDERDAAELKGKAAAYEDAAKDKDAAIASANADVVASLVEFAAGQKAEDAAVAKAKAADALAEATLKEAGYDVDKLSDLLGKK